MSVPIEDYALIGDCETAALVSRAGSIDWLCWPRFDSGACFAALLGGPEHGRWAIGAADDTARVRRAYRRNTLILETTIETVDGAVTGIDFMTPRGNHPDLVRIVRGDRGRVRMQTEIVLRFDYGCTVPWVTRLDPETVRAVAGPDVVAIWSSVPLEGRDLATVASFDVEAGSSATFVMCHGASHLPLPRPVHPEEALELTEKFWTEWVGDGADTGEWSDAVTRSMITLKALTYAPTGGIVAAPTTSLPEQFGGARNWDYRFCWIRDATLTLLALMNAGYVDEARAWRDWLLRAAAGAPSQIQIMYGLAGERRLIESEVDWLPGYENSRPVRLGNAAHDQLQLDVFGEVLDTLHQARAGGLHYTDADWPFQQTIVRHLTEVWMQPDHGIWEVRGKPRHFTYSKVMAWVALDRAVKAIEEVGLEGPLDEWRALRQAIHDDVCTRGFDRDLGSFVQSYGSKELDASLLLLPTVGFLPPTDLRIQGTIAAVEQHLFVNGLLRRYDTHTSDDGLESSEGAFLACTFWLADAYVLVNRVDEARALFERLLTLRNDVGLLSEEYDPRTGRLAGNFPQAFSHVALINTAHNLEKAAKPVEQRSGTRASGTRR